jgi:lipoate-protein ligase A
MRNEEKTLYLETMSQDPFYNLAFEEFILSSRLEGGYLLLWQNDNTIVIGQNQNAEAEINRSFVDAHSVRVARRTTGGGAVYHDLGNLNYSFITDAGEAERLTMERFTKPVVKALLDLGLAAEASGRNDILVDGMKVSGTAQRFLNGRVLFHGTLLFDSNLNVVSEALKVDASKYQSKGVQSVRSRVGNIRSFLKKDMDLHEFWEYLKGALSENGMTGDSLTYEELVQVKALKEKKYDTWDWNFGKSPKYNMTGKRKWDGGIFETRIEVIKGRIEQIAFYGDFLAVCPMEEITAQFIGVVFSRDAVDAVLANISIRNYFGGISKEEILETMF